MRRSRRSSWRRPCGMRLTNSSQLAARAAASTSSSVAPRLPRRMFSITVSSKSVTSWNTTEKSARSTSGSTVETSTPPTVTLPEEASQSRAARRAQVDLPEPDGPHEGGDLALARREAHVLQDLLAVLLIGEAHVLEDHVVPGGRVLGSALRQRLLEEAPHAARRGACREELGDEHERLVERRVDATHHQEEAEEGEKVAGSLGDESGADEQRRRKAQAQHDLGAVHADAGRNLAADGGALRRVHAVVDMLEVAFFLVGGAHPRARTRAPPGRTRRS